MHAKQQVSSFKFQHVDHLSCSHSVLKTCVCLFYLSKMCLFRRHIVYGKGNKSQIIFLKKEKHTIRCRKYLSITSIWINSPSCTCM